MRTRTTVPRTDRIALSTCVPKESSLSYRLNSGGKVLSGSAADTNRRLRPPRAGQYAALGVGVLGLLASWVSGV